MNLPAPTLRKGLRGLFVEEVNPSLVQGAIRMRPGLPLRENEGWESLRPYLEEFLRRLCSTYDAAKETNIAGMVLGRDGENRFAMRDYQAPECRGRDKSSLHSLQSKLVPCPLAGSRRASTSHNIFVFVRQSLWNTRAASIDSHWT